MALAVTRVVSAQPPPTVSAPPAAPEGEAPKKEAGPSAPKPAGQPQPGQPQSPQPGQPQPSAAPTPTPTPTPAPRVPLTPPARPQVQPRVPRHPHWRHSPYGYGHGYRWGWPRRPQLPPVLDYEPGLPAPDGYALETRMRKGYIIAGAITFGTTYLITVAVGAALQQDDGEAAGMAPMFVPVVGPFIAAGTGDPSPFGTFALVLDGVTQGFSLGMLLFGVLDEDHVWVRKREQPQWTVAPWVDGNVTGGVFRSSF